MVWVSIQGMAGKANTATADKCLVTYWTIECRILAGFQAHSAGPCSFLSLGWGIIELVSHHSIPGHTEAFSAYAGALMALHNRGLLIPGSPTEIAEDICGLNVVRIRTFSVHRSYANPSS